MAAPATSTTQTDADGADVRTRYVVTLEALPDTVPPPVRLKQFLKKALRAYGLRAVEIREVPK